MKSIFKKSAIGIAILGLAGSAYANMTGVFVGVDALDLQARNGDMDFVTVFPTATDGEVFTYNLHPRFTWDFRLFGGIKFCGNDDFTLSWTRFHTNTHNFEVDDPTSGSYVRWLQFLPEDEWTDIGSEVKYDLDEVYAVFGHTVRLMAWNFRFAGGVEWARLNSEMLAEATFNPPPATTLQLDPNDVYGYEAKSHMHGFGPRVEIDMVYNAPYGIAAFAKTNVALLIASREVELDPVDIDDNIAFEFSRRHVVIPKVGIKLGLSYTHGWGSVGGEGGDDDESSTFVTIEAGWQAESYIHAVERPEGFDNDSIEDGGLGQLSNLETKTSNYGYQGLFLGVTIATSWV